RARDAVLRDRALRVPKRFNASTRQRLHHAVELYLKAALLDTITVATLKRCFGHDLMALWARFKQQHNTDARLARFDATIEVLNKFEEIRYPGNPGPLRIHLVWRSEGVLAAQTEWARRRSNYAVIVEEIDRLVFTILQR